MLHMLLIVCVITCICDVFGLIIRRIRTLLEKLEKDTERPSQPMFNVNGEVPNAMDMIAQLALSKLNIYKLIRMFLSLVGVLGNIIMPYYLMNKFTKLTNASFHRQVHSYTPFMIVDFERVPLEAEDLAAVALGKDAKVKDINVLTSFNRYLAFMVSKVALKAIYSTFHAAYSPEGYLKHHTKRGKPTTA
ncbi:multidrug resistance-associated protein 5 [Babesia ovis]|uniref:Multidrug resistance-associated protein 5 n=1 Tax=Babesia ovis TaxID=5869 RepID=A0A9W5WUG5_BABOV|nr:multidrug resistance-associated protein 5 [Babesia ovis]